MTQQNGNGKPGHKLVHVQNTIAARVAAEAGMKQAEEAVKKRGKNWPVKVLAAYYRMMGKSYEETRVLCGVGLRTVKEWAADKETWDEATREAASNIFLRELVNAARVTLLNSIKRGNSKLAMEVLQSTIPELRPVTRNEHTGRDGGPIELAVVGPRQQ